MKAKKKTRFDAAAARRIRDAASRKRAARRRRSAATIIGTLQQPILPPVQILAETAATPAEPVAAAVASVPWDAGDILAQAAHSIDANAARRDLSGSGERSMARTVDAFNALTGNVVSERDGWLFMAMLKAARATAGAHNLDDYQDGASYFALAGECAEKFVEKGGA